MKTSLALHLFQIWEIFDWVGKVIFCHVWRIYQQQNLKHQLLRDITLDGPAIVQMLKPGISKTFEVYAKEVFLPYISLQLCKATRIDLVWDVYLNDSLKGTARLNRGQGIRRRVVGTGVIPGNWQNFLRVDSNKTELFSYLSQIVAQMPLVDDKQVYVTNGEQVLSNPRKEDNAALNPCGHEEADTSMMLHVAHAARHGHSKILIRTVNIDVVAIAVRIFQLLEALQQLWIAFGTGKSFC